ncbi:MAG: hypothetical protein IPM46_10555 [Flavobacteriales bacterium]|nr:hypothetical protein [Flavobacteriales bacterium]
MRKLLAFVYAASPVIVMAQVEVDRPIILESINPSQRQVLGLESSSDPGSALTVAPEQQGILRHSEPALGPIWNVELDGLAAPVTGAHITVKVPEGATGTVQLQLNGGVATAVEWEPGLAVEASTLPVGLILSLVFNGTAWQVMNGTAYQQRNCPGTMVAVNGQFCIERNQRDFADFGTAVNACAAIGRRMCTWGEFVAACQRRFELGINYNSSDWEWTNNSANEANTVRMVRLASCTLAGTRNMASTAPYRCCYTR